MTRSLTRRRFLRGTLAGAAITVGLPLLDVFLNAHDAPLASGAPPARRLRRWLGGRGRTHHDRRSGSSLRAQRRTS